MLCQERERYPVGIGAGLLSETCADIREGKTHCVVWAAGGLGWEKEQRAPLHPRSRGARLRFGLLAGTWAPATWPDWLCRICTPQATLPGLKSTL